MLCVSNMFGVVVSAILLSTVTDVLSRYVQHPEIHRNVVHKKVIATWDEAERRCEAGGAVMASPLDEEMLEYMRSSIGVNNHTTPYFIGFKATSNPEFIFASVEGVPLDDLPEAAMNMIEQLDPQDGDCLAMGRHNIRVVSCRARLPYICYKNDTSTSRTVTPVDVTTNSKPQVTSETHDNCSKGYTYLSGSYYKLHNESESTTWEDAQWTCLSEGGYLAVINDEHEAKTVKEFVFNEEYNWVWEWDWTFIGIRYHFETGDWRTVHGNPIDQVYHTWANNESRYYCGTIDVDGYLDDKSCSRILPFICEKQC